MSGDKRKRPIDSFPMHMQQDIRLVAAVVARKVRQEAKPEGKQG